MGERLGERKGEEMMDNDKEGGERREGEVI